jgi:hypothetical protein
MANPNRPFEDRALMAKPQAIGQSICAVCGKTARPGSALILDFGAGGRVHTTGCLALAQNRLPIEKSAANELGPEPKP